MKNIVYLLGIIFSAAIGIVLMLVFQMGIGDNFIGFSFLLSYAWMYRRGTFRKTIWNKVFFMSISLLMIGFIFKLQHWSFAGIFIIISSVVIACAYTLHFIQKRDKTKLDYFKWVLALAYLLKNYAILSHSMLIQNLQISLVYVILHIITLILFIHQLSIQPNWLQLNGKEEEDPYNLKEFLTTTNDQN
ncbi:MAG: hypothetical protein IPI46_05620 [Bacteroidetes bacterium]|nr:hypothetical protein [Bacteroidota bacterium]